MIDLDNLPENLEVFDSFIKAASKLGGYDAKDIMVSISGGADSDIMLDLVTRTKPGARFVFFNTGLEYQATKEHLEFLEDKYDIKIERIDAKMPIPTSCRKYGQPFLSKQVSENIERLQRHGFQWEDEPFDVLYAKYPKCKVALRWWCNQWGDNSRFNISYNKLLKEFMIAHPPTFKISNRCCAGAKKNVAKDYKKENGIRLSLVGVRKAEGGARSSIPNCFTPNAGDSGVDEYRPLFWYLNDSKKVYEEHFGVTHSRCYTEYGLTRTGCAGCPFGRDFEAELDVIREHEPKLLKAVNKIFGDAYEYTRAYRAFKNQAEAEGGADMSTPPPCYNRKTRTDCPRRAVGCRSSCPEWQKYETAHAAENAARAKARAQEAGMYEHYHAVRHRRHKDTGGTPRGRRRKV